MARVIGVGILILFAVSPALVQDAPKPPITAILKLIDPPSPLHVADRPAGLQINLVDSLGRPALLDGLSFTANSTDKKCSVNGFQVVPDKGVAVLRDAIQFFTPGTHEISVTNKDGSIKGQLRGIRVLPLQSNITFEGDIPKVKPKNLHAGTGMKLKSKLLSDGKPLPNKEVRLRGPKGMTLSPQRIFTDDLGFFECFVFLPEFCIDQPGPGPGPIGTLNGETPAEITCFVDCNGDNAVTALDPGDTLPPIEIVTPCAEDLILCARLQLLILISGGIIEPPPPGPGPIEVTVGSSPQNPKKANSKDQKARLEAALKFLDEQIIAFINDGRWNGRFSHVAERLDKLSRFLREIPSATGVVSRIDCARHIVAENPDVHSVELSTFGRQKKQRVNVGYRATMETQLFGQGHKRLTSQMFNRCLKPSQTIAVEGPGAVTPAPAPSFSWDFECTGPGNAVVSPTITFKEEDVIIIDNGQTLSAAEVSNTLVEIVQPAIEFKLTPAFTFIQVQAALIEAIIFNHTPGESENKDAIDIREDLETPVVKKPGDPEWVEGETQPKESPACYALNEVKLPLKIKVKARITNPANFTGDATVTAAVKPAGAVFGDVPAGTLKFKNGKTDPEFQEVRLDGAKLLNDRIIQVKDVEWTWQFSITVEGKQQDLNAGKTNHRIYVILNKPGKPWYRDLDGKVQDHLKPWTRAMDAAFGAQSIDGSKKINGIENPSSFDLMSILTEYMFVPGRLKYDTSGGGPYYWSANSKTNFLLTPFLNDFLAGSQVSPPKAICVDYAAGLISLAAVLGVEAQMATYDPFGYLNMVTLNGSTVPCITALFKDAQEANQINQNRDDVGNPQIVERSGRRMMEFQGKRIPFGYDAFAILKNRDGEERVFSPTFRVHPGGDPSRAPEVIQDLTIDQFIAKAVDKSTAAEKAFAENGTIPNIGQSLKVRGKTVVDFTIVK